MSFLELLEMVPTLLGIYLGYLNEKFIKSRFNKPRTNKRMHKD